MKHSLSRMLLCIGVLIALAIAGPAPSLAQASCDEMLIDRAELFDDTAALEAAGDRLIQQGAELRIRTVKDSGAAGHIDAYAEQLIRECATWRDASGERAPNLLLVMIAVDERKTGIYYGRRWNSVLDNHWLEIQQTEMNPRFREGDFTGGFVAGLTAIEQRIQPATAPPTPADQAAIPANPQPSQPATQIEVQPTLPAAIPSAYPQPQVTINDSPEQDPAFGGLTILAGLVLCAGGGYGGYLYMQERKRRLAAQQQARLARQSAAELCITLPEQLQQLSASVAGLEGRVSTEDFGPPAQALAHARQLNDAMLLSFGELRDHDPERRGLKVAQYEAIEAAYQQVCRQADQVTAAADELNRLLAALDTAIEHTPQAIADGWSTLQAADATVEIISSQGFRTNAAQQLLAQGRQDLDAAQQAIEERRFILAAQLAGTAAQQIRDGEQHARSLPEIKQQAETAAGELEARIPRVAEQIEPAKRTLDAIIALAAMRCWQPMAEHPQAVEQRVADSRRTLAMVGGMITMQQQEWEAALQQIAGANQRLDEAEQMVAAIHALKHELDVAVRDASTLIELARSALDRAESFVRLHDADIHDTMWHDLQQLTRQLASANGELSRGRPDYLQIVADARDVQQTAHRLLLQAQAQHQAMERLREQARIAIMDAQAAVAEAGSYIDRHRGDTWHETRQMADDAEQLLSQAMRAAAPQVRIEYANQARSQAEAAYKKARGEVSSAEHGRRRARRSSFSSRSSSSSGSSSSSSSSSGGGSSSW